jgi:pimeloyl-ACP methyl ester carboxylesterase
MRTNRVRVPGAELYYEVRGSGPTLLLICGGVYDAAGYAALADALADRYTVVTYDRRGNSRSPLEGPRTPQSIEVHADDAFRILTETAGGDPAYVFGNSSGAVIGLELAARHPESVRRLVAHEPPLFEVLPDREHWQAMVREIEETFAAQGPEAAGGVLAAAFQAIEGPPGTSDRTPGGAHAPSEPDPATLEMMGRLSKNMEFFIGYEVPPFARYSPDFDALAGASVVTAVGDLSHPDLPYVRAAHTVAQRLGVPTLTVPGDHGGFGSHAGDFAEALHKGLS